MKIASVDIGSNTTLLLVVEKNKEIFNVLEDEIYFTRLAEGIEKNKEISKNALVRLEKAFKSIREKLDALNVNKVCIVATSASRQANNQEELFVLANKFGFSDLQIIPSEEEASLTYLGAFFGLKKEIVKPLVIDIGGGSTEFVSSEDAYSLNIGSVSLTEKFLTPNPVSRVEKISLFQFIEKQLEPLQSFLEKDYQTIIFVAGTPIALAFIEKETSDPNKVHGLYLTQDVVEFWLNKLSKLSVAERKSQVTHLPEYRSDVIVSGLSIMQLILKKTQKKKFIISAAGVRYGLILKQLEQL